MKILAVLIALLILISGVSAIQLNSRAMVLSLVNTDPDPARAGEIVEGGSNLDPRKTLKVQIFRIITLLRWRQF